MESEVAMRVKLTAEMTITRCGCGATEYEPEHHCPNPTVETIPMEEGEDGVWRPSL